MNCTNKQQETAECEKRGCSGCFYNEKTADDLTTVYMSGFYDGEKKWKDKIKEKIEKLKEIIEQNQELIDNKVNATYTTLAIDYSKNAIEILQELLEE